MPDQLRMTVAWGGDVSLARRQHLLLSAFASDTEEGETAVRLPSFSGADLRMVNLECVVSDLGEQGTDKSESGPYYFRARPEMTRVLQKLGVDLVATANNHSGDYGPEALLDQACWLELANIAHAGSGRDREAAFAPRFFRRNGLAVAVFSLDATQAEFAATGNRPGHAFLPLSDPALWQREMQPRIQAARRHADVVIVAVHWGLNLKPVPGPGEIAAGHALIRAGADAVLGASAHMLQGIEIFEGRPILHDAGNLLCDFSEGKGDSAVFRLELGPSGVTGIEVIPVTVAPGRASEAEGDAAISIAADFAEKCAAFGTVTIPGSDGRLQIPLSPPGRVPQDYRLTALRSRLAAPPVPESARIAPVAIGPLTLHGVSFGPERLTSRNMLWVETWWSAEEPVSRRLTIALHAVPRKNGNMPVWGRGMAHEPGDWRLPTPHWQPGEIYHERFGLRPPPGSRLEDNVLDLEISVFDHLKRLGRLRTGLTTTLSFSGKVARNPGSARPADLPGWSAEELAGLTGGTWITPPPPGWFCRSAVAGRTHLAHVPEPVLFAAHSRQDRNRHESMTAVSKDSWDSHVSLHRLQDRLAGALVRERPPGLRPEFPLLQVEDPLAALMQIGGAARDRMRGKVVCVTGSSGKTTTVSMLQAALSPLINCRATYDNYNTRVGILVNLASVQPETDAVILETALSAINSAGQAHIRRVAPDIAVITNITTAHLREGETTGDIARRKSNIFLGMQPGKSAVIWSGSDHFDEMAERAREAALKLVTFGAADGSDFRLLSYDPARRQVEAQTPHGQLTYRIGASGVHMALNSLASLAVAAELSLDLVKVAEGFETFRPLAGRGETHSLSIGAIRFQLQDEAYNANPLSMRAALQSFAAAHASAEKTLILGDMLELGEQSPRLHAELLSDILALKPRRVMLVGAYMTALGPALHNAGIAAETAADVSAVFDRLPGYISHQGALLIKASNGVGLWKLVDHLTKAGEDMRCSADSGQ